jgi:translation initiation factor 5
MFGFELGAVTIRMDETNTYIVNGKFSANQLADVLDIFIDKFVLCGSCRNPETIVAPSKGQVKLRCISCGNETQCDPKHKLTDFILKDAARRKLKAKQEAIAANEANAGKKKSAKGKKEKAAGEGGGDEDGDATEWSVDVSSAAVKARRRAALGAGEEGAAGEGGAKEAHVQQSPEDEFKVQSR